MISVLPFVLLVFANIFMTFAWYGHLKNLAASPLWVAILVSWLIAAIEYCFQVPANRLGVQLGLSVASLKAAQEVITLLVFAVFSHFYLKEALGWNHALGFSLIALGAFFVFKPF